MLRAGVTIRIDPGWLYVIAGLAICVAGILVPAQRDLEGLRDQVARLAHEYDVNEARLAAHRSFIRRLDRGEPALLRRLAAAQLNLVAGTERPIMLAASRRATVAEWIEASVHVPEMPASTAPPKTLLARLVGGPRRLWFLGGGIVLLFVGLLVDGRPSATRAAPLPRAPALPPPDALHYHGNGEGEDEDDDADESEDEDVYEFEPDEDEDEEWEEEPDDEEDYEYDADEEPDDDSEEFDEEDEDEDEEVDEEDEQDDGEDDVVYGPGDEVFWDDEEDEND